MSDFEKYTLIAAELRERAEFPNLTAQREHLLAIAEHFECRAAEARILQAYEPPPRARYH